MEIKGRPILQGRPFLLSLPQPKHNPMPALWVLPLDILVRTANSAASALMAAFIPNVHPDLFPLIHFRRAKDRTDFVWALR
jgi:hypothetical protein